MMILAGMALALAACGSGASDSADDSNSLAADNMMMDDNMMLDPNAPLNGSAGLDSNASVDSNTQNLIEKDAATNDPDTNLANGL
ncbi:MAG TPA: hypothetical protein VF759_06190 [Allosphingosinicella sp.]